MGLFIIGVINILVGFMYLTESCQPGAYDGLAENSITLCKIIDFIFAAIPTISGIVFILIEVNII